MRASIAVIAPARLRVCVALTPGPQPGRISCTRRSRYPDPSSCSIRSTTIEYPYVGPPFCAGRYQASPTRNRRPAGRAVRTSVTTGLAGCGSQGPSGPAARNRCSSSGVVPPSPGSAVNSHQVPSISAIVASAAGRSSTVRSWTQPVGKSVAR